MTDLPGEPAPRCYDWAHWQELHEKVMAMLKDAARALEQG